MKQPEQSYTAIETAHGFVFFTDTTEGQKNRQDFLQFMADHYFDPHFNLGPVNVYRAEGVLKDGSYVNPGEGLYPEYAYLQMDKTPEMELVYRTLERTLNDRSVPFLINGTDAGEAMRQALLEGKWIYCPQISKSMPDLHFLHAEKTCNRVMAYTKSPVNKTVYQEKNGKIIPYVPALKKVSKTKRNNSLKM